MREDWFTILQVNHRFAVMAGSQVGEFAGVNPLDLTFITVRNAPQRLDYSVFFRGSSMEPRGNPVDSRTTSRVSMG
jgi:hypothetical protein